jgi:acyl-CoA hydrolase
MENHKLVLPEHLNQFGFLFGGNLLKWVDEYAWIAASLDFPGCNFVTIGMDRVEFKKSVRDGTILKFIVLHTGTGNTSVRYRVQVFHGNSVSAEKPLIFATNVTFVRVDKQGRKTTLPKT